MWIYKKLSWINAKLFVNTCTVHVHMKNKDIIFHHCYFHLSFLYYYFYYFFSHFSNVTIKPQKDYAQHCYTINNESNSLQHCGSEIHRGPLKHFVKWISCFQMVKFFILTIFELLLWFSEIDSVVLKGNIVKNCYYQHFRILRKLRLHSWKFRVITRNNAENIIFP